MNRYKDLVTIIKNGKRTIFEIHGLYTSGNPIKALSQWLHFTTFRTEVYKLAQPFNTQGTTLDKNIILPH